MSMRGRLSSHESVHARLPDQIVEKCRKESIVPARSIKSFVGLCQLFEASRGPYIILERQKRLSQHTFVHLWWQPRLSLEAWARVDSGQDRPISQAFFLTGLFMDRSMYYGLGPFRLCAHINTNKNRLPDDIKNPFNARSGSDSDLVGDQVQQKYQIGILARESWRPVSAI